MPRQMVGVRLSDEGLERISLLMQETEANKATVIRVLLSEALLSQGVVNKARARLLAMKGL
jgi:predicted DNA-binding protein